MAKAKKKKSTAVAKIEHAQVSNHINMNLSQTDLIDMIIEEKLDVL